MVSQSLSLPIRIATWLFAFKVLLIARLAAATNVVGLLTHRFTYLRVEARNRGPNGSAHACRCLGGSACRASGSCRRPSRRDRPPLAASFREPSLRAPAHQR